MTAGNIQMKTAMDRMYRWTRHIYDASRKYFLLGRDRAIAKMDPAPGQVVCEVGCGTARNLIKLARHYPQSVFAGLDISDEMLKTARKSIKKNNLSDNIQTAQGYAQNFNPDQLFSLNRPVEKFFFSYSLSIIPPWQESLDHALNLLPAGGEIHIIDFGNMEKLPKLFRTFLFWFLSKFHVYHKPGIKNHLQRLESERKGKLSFESYYGGYCYRAVFTKG